MASQAKSRESRIRTAIRNLGSIAEAAKALRGDSKTPLPRSTVKQWRDGSAEPRIDALVRLADVAGVSLDWLAGREDSPGKLRAVLPRYWRATLPRRANVSRTAVAAMLSVEDVFERASDHLARDARIYAAALEEMQKRAWRKIDKGAELRLDHIGLAVLLDAANAEPRTPALRRKRTAAQKALDQRVADEQAREQVAREWRAIDRANAMDRSQPNRPPAPDASARRKPATKRPRGAR